MKKAKVLSENRGEGGTMDKAGNTEAVQSQGVTLNRPAFSAIEGRSRMTIYRQSNAGSEPTSVYKYFDKLGILIYVGITRQSISRNAQHNLTKDWWPLVASQEIVHCASREAALQMERDLIGSHCPPFNKQGNPNQAAAKAVYLQLIDDYSKLTPGPNGNNDDSLLKELRSAPSAYVTSYDFAKKAIHIVVLPKFLFLMRGAIVGEHFKVVNYHAGCLSRSVIEIGQFGVFFRIVVPIRKQGLGLVRNRHRVVRMWARRLQKERLIVIEKLQILETWEQSHIKAVA